MQASGYPIVVGAPYSVYVRAVRLALEEKGVPYEIVPVDIFATGGPPPEHRARHPFGKIPAFEHAGFRLYEAGAITRYVDEAFPGPRLQPEDPHGRARMNQIISILDSYAYRTLVWDICRARRPAGERCSTRRTEDSRRLAEGRELPVRLSGTDGGDFVARRSCDHPGRPPCRADRLGVSASSRRREPARSGDPSPGMVGARQHASELSADPRATASRIILGRSGLSSRWAVHSGLCHAAIGARTARTAH